jgi:LmbE family N-acetylglucosaminyl deacetylase
MDVLAFFAHPDDETMLAGGTLALLARSGVQVHYLSATRGEGGERGEPPVCSLEQIGEVRQAELACAVEHLGASSLTFLDYLDPRVGPDDKLFAYTDDVEELAHQVAAKIRQARAGAVFTHGSNGEYGHPAHVVTHQAALVAVKSFGASAPLLYSVAATFPSHPRPRLANQDDPAHLVLDVTPALEQKTQAALCHRTQHALFVRRASEEAGRKLSVSEVIMRLESLRRIWPTADETPDDAVIQALKSWKIDLQEEV